MFKKGYENGEKVIEVYDGKFDVVIFSECEEKGDFYFYRFPAWQVLGMDNRGKPIKIGKICLTERMHVEDFLKGYNLEYDSLLNNLIKLAIDTNMTARTDM